MVIRQFNFFCVCVHKRRMDSKRSFLRPWMFKDITIACINTLTLTALLFIYQGTTVLQELLQYYRHTVRFRNKFVMKLMSQCKRDQEWVSVIFGAVCWWIFIFNSQQERIVSLIQWGLAHILLGNMKCTCFAPTSPPDGSLKDLNRFSVFFRHWK